MNTGKPEKSLRGLRMEREWNLTQFAEKAGVNVSALSLWETGHRVPNWANARKLAKALDISVDEIYAAIEVSKKNRTGPSRETGNQDMSYLAAFSFGLAGIQ